VSLDLEVLAEPEALELLAPEWHALATACAEPLAAPAWVLTMWRLLDREIQEPRVVTMREGGQLIALAPLCFHPGHRRRGGYRLLSGEMPRTTPLALPGRAWEAAGALAGIVAELDPRPGAIAFESIPTGSPWPLALAEQWPARMRPWLRRYFTMSSPTVALTQDSFDDWLGSKSSNFRSQMRRMRRKFAQAGGTGRFSTQATLHDDVAALVRLHTGRWEGRGESSIVAGGAELAEAFEAVGRALLDEGGFRLHLLELDGEPISAQLFAGAGGDVIYYNGGWDERHAQFKPAMLGILDAIEDAFARGERRMDLGPGAQPYKLRFADGTDPLSWWVLIPPGRRMPAALARTLPMTTWRELRTAAKRALPPERIDRLRAARSRLS
jgi:CelD/BcsL family acetyltransferase involved in cellulose biosynthesis